MPAMLQVVLGCRAAIAVFFSEHFRLSRTLLDSCHLRPQTVQSMYLQRLHA